MKPIIPEHTPSVHKTCFNPLTQTLTHPLVLLLLTGHSQPQSSLNKSALRPQKTMQPAAFVFAKEENVTDLPFCHLDEGLIRPET